MITYLLLALFANLYAFIMGFLPVVTELPSSVASAVAYTGSTWYAWTSTMLWGGEVAAILLLMLTIQIGFWIFKLADHTYNKIRGSG